ncbi:conserved hypothetical protein [Ricinus communis]|uniref:Uncharacterized protein n=1 Tax=Ricinus communis TaxID=3988 RepID=B9RWH3_RICCO|nr:conserved hypothetical protein [Ricinus communis]
MKGIIGHQTRRLGIPQPSITVPQLLFTPVDFSLRHCIPAICLSYEIYRFRIHLNLGMNYC